mmetsp:Transcript_12359/g.30306  ORF Transcript_12359/g.30306 Transcript_12359/m.30306 type:complete len:110 (-) Transcript_12359:280-609(-)|eukprot:CAMPEP_0202868830 /NCGR_PEP_ID=MMETSP1391-20130828/11178_1 /ASSEMBLY_ACC=CAM_ASM_000867 /TAXON_ID=1034604 /ORGANISM="Chlamydomonas leiostraca, Strain SAG 11-49" /LENGTH=109 /DNA_ID=CAMNT_0049549041 /DNA_START=50 /DNA_END=379 /DNA_ORIENTATION=-
MEETGPLPRVNYEAMQRFVGQKVSLFAELKSVEQGRVIVKTSDEADVTVVGNLQSGTPYDSQFVEIIGRVVDARTIEEEMHTNLGQNIDMKLYNEMVKLSTGKYSQLFM